LWFLLSIYKKLENKRLVFGGENILFTFVAEIVVQPRLLLRYCRFHGQLLVKSSVDFKHKINIIQSSIYVNKKTE
jgi:hypothetical protein